jgi:uncharacterized surface protein with fasciclin (FAS1) repeats
MKIMAFLPAVAAIALAPLAACSDSETKVAAESPDQRLSAAIAADGDISKFARALQTTGLAGIFEGPAEYTVLAPEDGAFGKLNGDLEAPVVAAILREHILPGAVLPDDIKASLEKAGEDGVSMVTMGSGVVSFSLEEGRLVATSADGKKAVLSDSPVKAANGVLIPVDGVLKDAGAETPPSA